MRCKPVELSSETVLNNNLLYPVVRVLAGNDGRPVFEGGLLVPSLARSTIQALNCNSFSASSELQNTSEGLRAPKHLASSASQMLILSLRIPS